MAWMRRIGLLLVFFVLFTVGCSSQADQEATPTESVEQGASDKKFIPTRDESPHFTETASVETETPPTAVSTMTAIEVTQQVSGSLNQKANADVLFVLARQEPDGTWNFSVTVEHPDKGWEDYADGWDVIMPDGSIAKPDEESPFTRLLLHPHETEQPFTRNQSGILISSEISEVTVRAHDLVYGFGGREVVVDLTSPAGPDFEVYRQTD
ncbi:MAG: hypothetical protein ACK2T1_06335 [Candidatus Promineifilaceae bacterium]